MRQAAVAAGVLVLGAGGAVALCGHRPHVHQNPLRTLILALAALLLICSGAAVVLM